ncbi:unnamed protein product [Blepharisma stoltei]|uniref:Receptor ligand binding region domain-containing protein n=1 Tax=Blepharisma stoltei TaxID=1481888 RepID=A0AAU9J077_9CILI|nr:unnamed protein product [Blepharisma stoltei]
MISPQYQLIMLLIFLSYFKGVISLEIITVYPEEAEESWSSNYKPLNISFLLESFQILEPSAEIYECNISNIIDCISAHKNALILLDLSNDIAIQFSLSQVSKNHFLIHLVYQKEIKYLEKWSYSISSSYTDQLNAFFSMLNYFGWKEGVVFSNNIQSQMKEEIYQYSQALEYLTIESTTNIDELVNKIVYRLGANLYYILTENFESADLQLCLKNKELLVTGNGLILSQESGYGAIIDGTLIITEIGHELDNSYEDVLTKSVIEIITYITNRTSSENFNEISLLLDSYLPYHYKKNEFSIVNIQNGERIIIGSIINGNVTISRKAKFPGKTEAIPKSIKKILTISINDGTTNPGASSTPVQKTGSIGAYIAKNKINESNDVLANFQISLTSFDCGVSIYNASFVKSCISNGIDRLGLSFLSPFGSAVTVGVLKAFDQLKLKMPTIGSVTMDPSLASTDTYPMFVRLIDGAIYSQVIIVLKALGWTKGAIMYENNGWGIPAYKLVIENAEKSGFEFINPESSRAIPPSLNSTAMQGLKENFQAVIDCQARLFLVIVQCPACNYAIELLYDLGIRKGDIIVMAGAPELLNYFIQNDTNLYKRSEVGYAALTIANKMFVGDIGADTKKRILAQYNVQGTPSMCCYFDSLYLAASALDYMINRGQNYSDSSKMIKALRTVEITGCSGRIRIDKTSNDRIFYMHLMQGIKTDENGNPAIYIIGELRPYSTKILTITTPIVYADGTTNKPSDLRNQNDNCPFPTKDIRTFDKGRGVLFAICFTVGLVTAITTFIIWKKWWNISVEELKEKEEISFQDFVLGFSIAIEFFQYTSMGPDYSFMSSFLYDISNILSLSLGSVLKLENGVFWIVVDGIYAGIAVWIFLCAVVLLRLDEKWQHIWIFRISGTGADYLMPILGNLCFIPFISICLDIFVCDQSIGDNFTDSFLAKDCYYFCWKDEHLAYAILAFIALIAYEPLAVFCRPLWQELQPALHVKAVPLFLMVKTVVQTALIVLNKTVKRSSDVGHGVVFIFIMIIYVAFIFRFKPYNYARFSWWQGLTLVGVVWLAILSTIELGVQDHNISTVLLIILIFGWITIASIGLYIQRKKYPSLLFKKKARDTSTLFKFAFTFGKQSKKSLETFKSGYKSTKIIPEKS